MKDSLMPLNSVIYLILHCPSKIDSKNCLSTIPTKRFSMKTFHQNFFLGSEHLLNIGFLRKQLFQFFKEFTWGFNATLFVEFFCYATFRTKLIFSEEERDKY